MPINYKKIIQKVIRHRAFLYLSPLILYMAVACILWGPTHLTDIHRAFFTPSGDPYAFVWYLRWWPFSIAHGLNPILENFVYYPNGFNLAWSTSIPTLALIMAPFTAIWGAVASFNILALVALPFSALSCYYLIYYMTHKYWASVLSGFIYGFSSLQLGELLGHPSVYVSFVPPLVVLVVLMSVRGKLSRVPFILLLALLFLLQFGISTELFGSMCLFGAAAWILVYIFADKQLRPKIFATSIDIALAGVLAVIILTPFIYYLIKGYSGVPKVINSPLGYSADLLNYVIPTKITLLGGHAFENISKNFAGNPSEQGAYLGIPLILIMAGYAIFYWRKWYGKVLVIMAALLSISSLGPNLQVNGKITPIPLPWWVPSHLPILRSMLPTRFPMYLSLVAAIMLGLWLSHNPKRVKKGSAKKIQAFKYGAAVVAILFLLPAASNYSWQRPNIPPLFTPKLTKKYIGLNKNILILPLSDGADPELWQVSSDMEFRTTDGYLGFVPWFVISNPTTVQISSDLPGPDFINNFLIFCKAHQISEIVYTPSGLPDSIEVLNAIKPLGWPSFDAGGATIITVPPQYQ